MKLIQQLIRIESLSGKEEKIQEFIAADLKRLGFVPINHAGNVIVKIAGEDPTRALIFDAHVDTVSAGEASAWAHPPLAGYAEDKRVYGLGASDNKASVASLLLLAGKLGRTKPACDVWLWFVVGEEVDGAGTKGLMDWWKGNKNQCYTSVAGVVMEPTHLSQIEIGHRGNGFVKITAKGKSGHGSKPLAFGDNAVLQMAETALKLQILNGVWARKYHDPWYGPPTLGVGTSIQAGDGRVINKFADSCVMTVDVRTVPAMHDKLLALIREYLDNPKLEVEWAQEPAGYGLVGQDNAVVAAMQTVLPEAVLKISPGATDQCFFTQAGIPALIVGPGVPTGIHQANEYCEPDLIERLAAILPDFISAWAKMMANAAETQ